jgi:hypothetical protein
VIHSECKRIKKVLSTVEWKEEDTKENPEMDKGMVMAKDIMEREIYPTHVLTAVRLDMSYDFVPNCVFFVYIFIVLSMSAKTILTY